MNPGEAVEKLERMQSQIIHGTSIFGEIATIIRQHCLTWTGVVPSVEGWFWFRIGDYVSIVKVVRLIGYGNRLCCHTVIHGRRDWWPLDEIPRESKWAGPIPEPPYPNAYLV